ncbi:MAG: ferredoxin [Phaeodactylibacter sp.]|uniref:ferredoxin n=1 Tax=Phaeodactylibacter sp. TaxID=1940289 RepID=UPI0032EE3D9F
MSQIQISFLRHKCIGCNACIEAAPEHWVISKTDGKSYLRKSRQRGQYYLKEVNWLEYDANARAADNCPVKIIRLKEV